MHPSLFVPSSAPQGSKRWGCSLRSKDLCEFHGEASIRRDSSSVPPARRFSVGIWLQWAATYHLKFKEIEVAIPVIKTLIKYCDMRSHPRVYCKCDHFYVWGLWPNHSIARVAAMKCISYSFACTAYFRLYCGVLCIITSNTYQKLSMITPSAATVICVRCRRDLCGLNDEAIVCWHDLLEACLWRNRYRAL